MVSCIGSLVRRSLCWLYVVMLRTSLLDASRVACMSLHKANISMVLDLLMEWAQCLAAYFTGNIVLHIILFDSFFTFVLIIYQVPATWHRWHASIVAGNTGH